MLRSRLCVAMARERITTHKARQRFKQLQTQEPRQDLVNAFNKNFVVHYLGKSLLTFPAYNSYEAKAAETLFYTFSTSKKI